MKHILLLSVLLPLLGSGQTIPRLGRFSLMASYGVNSTLQQPQVTVIRGPYELRPETVDNPECYDDNGRLVNCNGKNQHMGMGVLYRLSNRSQTAGWMLFANASIQQQTFTLNYPDNRRFYIPVNCTPSIRRHLRSTGASVAVGRFWDVQQGAAQLFVRLRVMMAQNFSYLRGTYLTRLPDPTPVRYISGGNGTLIEMSKQVPQYNYLITPEIGLTSKDFPIELAVSVHVPIVQPTVFSELHTFAENNRIVGQNRVDYSNAVFNLTARLGINLSRKNKWAPAPRRPREPAPLPPTPASVPPPVPSGPDPAPVHRSEPTTQNDRFGSKPANRPITLLVNFELSKANLLPDSFTDLEALARWMANNPTAEIRLEGHTDLIGDAPENLDLSRRRVVAVKEYLSRKGVSSYRVETAYFGETRPLNRNCPPPTYCPENRRVEMVILKR